MPESFFAIFIHMPVVLSYCLASQSDHFFLLAKGRIGSSAAFISLMIRGRDNMTHDIDNLSIRVNNEEAPDTPGLICQWMNNIESHLDRFCVNHFDVFHFDSKGRIDRCRLIF